MVNMITPRERMSAVLQHKKPDRIPTTMHARGEVQRQLIKHFKVSSFDEVLDILGARLYYDIEPHLTFPEFENRINGTVEGDCPFAGKSFIFHDNKTFEDAWGVIRRIGSNGKYVEWISGPLADTYDPDKYKFPDKNNIIKDQNIPKVIQKAKDSGLFTRVFIPNPYKSAWYLRGMENLLMDYITNPRYVRELYRRIYDFWIEVIKYYTLSGVDMIAIEGDIAMQDRIIMGAERWHAIDQPVLADMITESKKINPEITTFFHSDGNIMPVMDGLITAGFYVLDSLQPECIDPFEVKEKYGDKIVMHGCGSLQKTLPHGSPEDCRREVIRLIEGCGRDGGLVLRPSNMIGYDVPLENIITWFEAARDYRV